MSERHDEEDSLREAFASLRAHDEASAPSFARTLAASRARAERLRVRSAALFGIGVGATGTLALAAALALTLRPVPALERSAPYDASALEPLRFLSAPPTLSVVSGERPYDAREESW